MQPKQDDAGPASCDPNEGSNKHNNTTSGLRSPTAAAVGEAAGSESSPSSFASHPKHLVPSIREYLLLTLASSSPVEYAVGSINAPLVAADFPERTLLTPEELVSSSCAVAVALFLYYALFGKRNRSKRRRLAEELRLAQLQVSDFTCVFHR